LEGKVYGNGNLSEQDTVMPDMLKRDSIKHIS